MGKLIFTPVQKLVFDQLSQNTSFKKQFYFTGGTALSVFYLQHRLSEDLDFFSEKKFDQKEIIFWIKQVSQELKANYRFTEKGNVLIFQILKGKKELTKIDFAHYPYPRIVKGIECKGMIIDSLRDIAINKLLSVIQRTEVKDFVDLYFLLREKFTIWDLIYGLEAKFRMEIDILVLGADLLAVEEFEFLPKMIKPLTLKELKDFFFKKAKQLGQRVVKE